MPEGFLEAVERFQVRGWAFDPTQPDRHLRVEILFAGRPVGTTVADRYRADLEQGGVGRGDHAFVFNSPEPLPDDAFKTVSARVREGGIFVLRQGLPQEAERQAPSVAQPMSFAGECHDEAARPVFVLGAVRSGTSAIAQALVAGTRYRGYDEGHVIDLLAHFSVAIENFYGSKAAQRDDPGSSAAIKRVPSAYFRDGIDSLFVQAARALFPEPYWVDKTPSTNMIHIVPILRRIWPNGKFIFMKRRAIENLMSRSRKFAAPDFVRDCREWSEALDAWQAVKSEAAGCALQIDQVFVAESPDIVAREVAALLSLEQDEAGRLAQVLAADRPERTSDVFAQVYDAGELGWNAEQWQTFDQLCGRQLEQFGYSRNKSYFASDDQSLRIQRI